MRKHLICSLILCLAVLMLAGCKPGGGKADCCKSDDGGKNECCEKEEKQDDLQTDIPDCCAE